MNNDSYLKKTGILGGTFNPIHVGHLMLAQNAVEYCELDEVLIMPSGVSYLKDPDKIAPVEHRLEMTRLAIEGNDRFVLSTIETDRGGNSYTYETLEALTAGNPDTQYYYIIGADTLFSMETWKNPEKIFAGCTVVCAKRDSYSDDELAAKAQSLTEKYGAKIIIMDIPEVPVSSTTIRQQLEKGMSCRYYLDDKVIDYIRKNGLYTGKKE